MITKTLFVPTHIGEKILLDFERFPLIFCDHIFKIVDKDSRNHIIVLKPQNSHSLIRNSFIPNITISLEKQGKRIKMHMSFTICQSVKIMNAIMCLFCTLLESAIVISFFLHKLTNELTLLIPLLLLGYVTLLFTISFRINVNLILKAIRGRFSD